MNQDQIKEQAQAFIAALQTLENNGSEGVDQIVDLFSNDAELTNPAIEREGAARVGRTQIAGFWQTYRTAFCEIRSEFFEVTLSEHAAGLFWRSTGAHVTGEPVSYEGVSLLNFNDDGKIVRFKGFYDSNQVTTKVSV